ncbi:hypothetical protein [Aliamphritea spongicola]|uniref:hypothetical protein n=1 Tax=Aliamphritea spongicola TaxID=707589 RepID=UPI00196B344F|nr:hypothetical protein [Aliamphritea spongicola]MBN3562514.1 hypothetical protein [Aliamphritea spongicola]
MDSAIVYNLPLFYVLALIAIRQMLLIGMLWMAWGDSQTKAERKGLIQSVVSDLHDDFSSARVAVLLMILI